MYACAYTRMRVRVHVHIWEDWMNTYARARTYKSMYVRSIHYVVLHKKKKRIMISRKTKTLAFVP